MSTFLEDKKVKIRKEHHCWGCARKFEKGNELHFLKSVGDGGFLSTYWCKTCDEYWNKFMESDEEIGFGDFRHEDKERWEELRKSIEG